MAVRVVIIRGTKTLPQPDIWGEEIVLQDPTDEQRVIAIALIKNPPITVEEVIVP